jgi:hypothetical protein
MDKVTKEQFVAARAGWYDKEYTTTEWIIPYKVLWTAYFDGEGYKIINQPTAYSIEFIDTPTEHTENVYYLKRNIAGADKCT